MNVVNLLKEELFLYLRNALSSINRFTLSLEIFFKLSFISKFLEDSFVLIILFVE